MYCLIFVFFFLFLSFLLFFLVSYTDPLVELLGFHRVFERRVHFLRFQLGSRSSTVLVARTLTVSFVNDECVKHPYWAYFKIALLKLFLFLNSKKLIVKELWQKNFDYSFKTLCRLCRPVSTCAVLYLRHVPFVALVPRAFIPLDQQSGSLRSKERRLECVRVTYYCLWPAVFDQTRDQSPQAIVYTLYTMPHPQQWEVLANQNYSKQKHGSYDSLFSFGISKFRSFHCCWPSTFHVLNYFCPLFDPVDLE